jgi:hypothetical protein
MAFRARSKQRRKNRIVLDDELADEDEDDIDLQLRKAKPSLPKSDLRVPTKLSFGDDEGDGVVVKKKKKKPKARGMSLQTLESSSADATEREYSAQALADLKLSTPQMPQSFATARFASSGADVGMQTICGMTLVRTCHPYAWPPRHASYRSHRQTR